MHQKESGNEGRYEKAMAPHSSTPAWKIPWMEEPGRLQSMGSLRVGHDWATFTFHFHALEKEMATHSSVLAWRIPGTGEPGGLPSMGSHRVGHDWSDLAAAAAESVEWKLQLRSGDPGKRRTVVRVGPIAKNQRGRGHTMTPAPRWQRVWKNEGHLQYRRCGTGSYQEAVKEELRGVLAYYGGAAV